MEILFIVGIPLVMAAASFFAKNARFAGIVNFFGHCAAALAGLLLIRRLFTTQAPICLFGFFYADALSAFFIFTISLLNVAASLYSIDYIARDVVAGHITERKARTYYFFFNLFAFSMYCTTVFNNVGLVWVAVEMTTLASAFLVGFYTSRAAIEAAWKYIIICSVGIALALFGVILMYYTVATHAEITSMNWTDIVAVAGRLDPRIVKVAFLFILVGYGTKAGLAPMHTWLPDAHSQALSPVSALLSGVLLPTALYAIARFVVIVNRCVGGHFTQTLLVGFGLLSLALSAAFIVAQKDMKRLLAYSSIEHIGIACIALGIASPLALYGALLHIFNHAVTKAVMFFGAGDIIKAYKTGTLREISGVVRVLPFTGIALIIGTFALIGLPPFSIFLSEIIILICAFLKGAYAVTALTLFFISVIFAAMVHHMSGVLFGKAPDGMEVRREPLTAKCAFSMLLIFVCGMGIIVPWLPHKLIVSASEILRGM